MTIQDANPAPSNPNEAIQKTLAEDAKRRDEQRKQEEKSNPAPQKEYEFHPYANIFPLMEGEEFKALVDDIKANGLREPITVYEGKILDGRNRYRAVMDAGHQYRLKDQDFKPYTGTKPLEFVISANVHRRHLDTSQRALTAARLVTSKLGDNQYRGGVTTEAAAKMLNVSEALVKDAKNVLDKAAPELQAKVQKGQLRIGAVKEVLDKPKEQQQQALKDAAKARRQTAQANKEASKAKSTPPSTEKSDEVDQLTDALVGKLKEMKKKDPESAFAATAELIRLLEAADLMGEEEQAEAA
jgi:ParB-like chromosome segregation protein Spo0J